MEISRFSAIPFVLLLLSIAITPFIPKLKWDKNYYKVSIFFSAVVIIYYIDSGRNSAILKTLEEYVMFISLIASLFIIAGGILIEAGGSSGPFRNILLLAIGAAASNIIGTTGASMLLIRPFIKINKQRISGFHIIFFIFIVSNIGGVLTPVGDPPLLLGYLKGIPFFWLIDKVFFKWLIAIVILLAVFFIIDSINYRKHEQGIKRTFTCKKEKMKFSGLLNVIFLAIVTGSIFITGPLFLREIIMLSAAFISYKTTKKEVYVKNNFSFHSLKEVGWLFFGIFMTMMPVLELLAHNSAGLNLTSASQFYWFTGISSSFLDNAPAYLTFLTTAMGVNNMDINNAPDLLIFLSGNEKIVMSISVSSVFFGAMTYIGNAPNFMVKSIAESYNLKMPGFFRYMFRFSIPVLFRFSC